LCEIKLPFASIFLPAWALFLSILCSTCFTLRAFFLPGTILAKKGRYWKRETPKKLIQYRSLFWYLWMALSFPGNSQVSFSCWNNLQNQNKKLCKMKRKLFSMVINWWSTSFLYNLLYITLTENAFRGKNYCLAWGWTHNLKLNVNSVNTIKGWKIWQVKFFIDKVNFGLSLMRNWNF